MIRTALSLLALLVATPADAGTFWREHWYERGSEDHPPVHTRRLRINSPDTSLGKFAGRAEARENGLMLITAGENLLHLEAAELYAELWGGHPNSGEKRLSVNGRSTYTLPDVGTPAGHCTYSYPTVPLKLTDLVNGTNAIQWAIDKGETFWGHAMVDHAALRVQLKPDHPDLADLGLTEFQATVSATTDEDKIHLKLDTAHAGRIASVTFHAHYEGFDDNGDTRTRDWHGFTFEREPQNHAGHLTAPPFETAWDTSMLPGQADVSVRATVRFKDAPGLFYRTAATGGLAVIHPPGTRVQIITAADLPDHFWSRANHKKTCTLVVPGALAKIERAQLTVITWTGGPGEVEDYFTLNGRHYPVAEGSGHHIQFSRLPVDVSTLVPGANPVTLLSDTHHHGIEIILPGPALTLRIRE